MKTYLIALLVIVAPVLFVGSMLLPSLAEANTGSGWELATAEFLGDAVGCEPGQSKRDFVLHEFGSTKPIANTAGLMVKTQVVYRSGPIVKVVRESDWVYDTNRSPAICFEPTTESPRLIVQTSSAAGFYPYVGAGWWPSDKSTRLKERGVYLRGFAQLQPKSILPTIEVKSPIDSFLRTATPAITVTTNSISRLYGATGYSRSWFGLWKNGMRTNRYMIKHGGAEATRVFTPMTLIDGLYTMTVVPQLNGSAKTKKADTLIVATTTTQSRPSNNAFANFTDDDRRLGSTQSMKNYSQGWDLVSEGIVTTPVNFYIDTTLPTASVTVTGTSTQVESLINSVVTVQDMGSGIKSFSLVLIPVRSPGSVASVTVPFVVGAGLIGGPKDAQTVRMSLRVLPGTDYQYYVVATDAAGNRYQSPRQNLRTDNVYPDLDASNFRIINTCLPEDVGGNMSAICPVTRADMRMNNVGGREIPNGTRVSYRIESQPAAGGSWTTVTTGNYLTGLQPGALSSAMPLTLANLRGGSRLRLAVNLAPQLNAAIGEQNFSNNTSAPLTLVFTQEPPRLLLEVDRSLVRINDTVTVRWKIESLYSVSCELQDGANRQRIEHASGLTEGTAVSAPIVNSRTITLICTAPSGVETRTSVDVSVVPAVQEV
jgi:hypothetical protein